MIFHLQLSPVSRQLVCIHVCTFRVKTSKGFVKGDLTKPTQRSCIYKYFFDLSPMTLQPVNTTRGLERCYHGNMYPWVSEGTDEIHI